MVSNNDRKLVKFYDAHPALIPFILELACAAYVAISAIGSAKGWFTFHPEQTRLSQLGDFYIGSAGAIAIVAGFVGVVVVFVYSAASPTFVSFRKTAEPELMKNWRSIVASSFMAVGLFLAATLLNVIWSPVAAWFISLFGLALSADAGARVIRQFFVMLRLNRVHDREQREDSDL